MKFTLLTICMLLIVFSCNNRDGLINPRNNPYDSGGINYRVNGAPRITGKVDTSWYNYDPIQGKGVLKLSFKADDPNLPTDTLATSISYGMENSELSPATPLNDSQSLFYNISPGAGYRCALTVTDAIDTTDTMLFFTAPTGTPPFAPEPVLTIDNNSVTLSWDYINGAMGYVVYSSGSSDGPFLYDTSIIQPSEEETISVTFPFDDKTQRWYIVASANEAGESHSTDTLMARIYSSDITVPVIDSVTKGVFSDHIDVTWYTNDAAVAQFGIYRSENDTNNFKLIDVVNAASEDNLFIDSTTSESDFYYKLAAISKEGRSSMLSNAILGFIIRDITSTTLTIESGAAIGLFWDPLPEAIKYYVYQGEESCTGNFKKIATVTKPNYYDSVSTTDQYYYTVAPVNSAGIEGPKSNCVSGSIGTLPAPTGIKYSNSDRPNTISIYWNPVKGAEFYTIYRSTTSCPDKDNVYTVTTKTEYHNENITSGIYYYKISATDAANRTGQLSICHKENPERLTAPKFTSVSYLTYPDFIKLTWTPVSGAIRYHLYRSSKSCESGLERITTTKSTTFNDSVTTTDVYYYMVAAVDDKDIEGSRSSCETGRLKPLTKPENVVASRGDYSDKIKITWSKVPGASHYTIYHNTSSNFASATVLASAVSGTDYVHPLTSTRTQYYWVAANNKKGTGLHSDYAYGWIVHASRLSISRYTASVVLTWSTDESIKKVLIYRSSDSSNLKLIDSTTRSSFVDYNATYKGQYYQIKGRTSAGSLIPSNLVFGYKLLPTPTGLRAEELSNSVNLTWNNFSEGVKFIVYRSTSISNPDSIATVSSASFVDKINNNTRYYYRIAADNGTQRSSMSTYVVAGIMRTPLTPISLSASGTEFAVRLRWYVSASSSTPSGFTILRATEYDGVYSLIDSTNQIYYNDSISGGDTYYYRVAAYNDAGSSTLSAPVAGKLAAAEPPSDVEASYGTKCSYVMITWNPTNFETDSFAVYRSGSSRGTYTKIGVIGDTVYFDTTATPKDRYFYRVATIRNNIEGTYSSDEIGMRLGAPEIASVEGTFTGIDISWEPISSAIQMYYLYRSATKDGTYSLVDSMHNYWYFDTTDLPGVNYYKVVARVDELTGMSEAAGPAMRPFPQMPYGVDATENGDSAIVTVSWEAADGADSYRVYRSPTDSFLVDVTMIGETDTLTFVDSVPSDSFYYYKIKAVNRRGESSLSRYARGFRIPTTEPIIPTDIDTLSHVRDVIITWKMSTQTIAYDGFRIYRSESEDGTYTLIGSRDGIFREFVDQPPSSFPATYWYKVTAYNASGESGQSAAVEGSRP